MIISSVEDAIRSMGILIVDDNEIARAVLGAALRNRGFYNILAVESAEAALEEIKRFNTDLVILDVMMPGIDGFACCKAIRSIPWLKDLPVLIETAVTDPDLRLRAFESGATDFISNPILPDELYARVRVHLQNRKYIKTLERYKERMTQELQGASQLQASVMPKDSELGGMRSKYGLDMAFHFEPSSEIGGDFWGMKGIGAQEVALWMVDFSGHGVSAALNAFRLQAHLKEDSPLATSPGNYMTHLNAKLLQSLPVGHFATMFYGVVDMASNTLSYSCACAPNPIFVHASSGKAHVLSGKGNLLGVTEHTYATQQIEMYEGDILILYSDALIETANAAGKNLDERVLVELAVTHSEQSAEDLKKVILNYFNSFTNGVISDDFTLFVCKKIRVD